MPQSISATREPTAALVYDVSFSSSHPFVLDLTSRDLACGICRKRCPAKPPSRWDLEMGQALCRMGAKFCYIGVCSRVKEKCGPHLLSQVGMWKCYYCGLDYIR